MGATWRSRKRRFHGNRYTSNKPVEEPVVVTASTSKLKNCDELLNNVNNAGGLTGNRIIAIDILISVFAALCCPLCHLSKLQLTEDSRFGLCSNLVLSCSNCSFAKPFSTTNKDKTNNEVNTRFVYALRLIGKGYAAGKKLCATLNLPTFLSKLSFRQQENKLLCASKSVAMQSMETSAKEIIAEDILGGDITQCGISVDGTWQRRGYSSLNGVVSAISIVTGKILDIEVMSSFCRTCNKFKKLSKVTSTNIPQHNCANHSGSAGSMEVVGAYRIFERSENVRALHYTEYYGDGDSKAFEAVKHIYGNNSVEKFECIGHIQKRVGTQLRKLKTTTKGLGGKGKLTDSFINKLQNYYGIAIRANSGDLLGMQSATIASFAHCCSGKHKSMHGQCPKGVDSWCKYQRSLALGKSYKESSPGLPQSIINIIKPTYMKLCDQKLLRKCLHGKTQNANESFNGVLWTILPKTVFVESQTLHLGSYLAVIEYNDGFSGLEKVMTKLNLCQGYYTQKDFNVLDRERVADSKRHSLLATKTTRKKLRAIRKKKSSTNEKKEGILYKSGEF